MIWRIPQIHPSDVLTPDTFVTWADATPPLLPVIYTVDIVAFPWADSKYTCELDRTATPLLLPVYYTADIVAFQWADSRYTL